jgi:hypothetical protein
MARYAYLMRHRAACLLVACACSCGRPFLAQDGTLVVPQSGAHGAAVLTANGLEFHDRADVPERLVVRDPYEPWRAPVGFLLPASGRFTRTSVPTVLSAAGLEVSLRPSDTRVPSWGGEMLVRIDVLAPAAGGSARWGEDVGVVVDGRGPDTEALFAAALHQLGGRDRVVVVDTSAARMVVPLIPASNRSLLGAAVSHRLASARLAGLDRARALAIAAGALSRDAVRRMLVLTDADKAAWTGAAEAVGNEALPLLVLSTAAGDDLDGRVRELQEFLPPAGEPSFDDVVLAFEGAPAPSHVLEASGGDARWELEGGELALGDVRAGDERTEVVRVTIPAWTPGEAYTLHVAVRFDDLDRGGERQTLETTIACAYDDDIERLAESRHGDVIAYASALATVARLDAAFLGGSAGSAAEIRTLALMHARSLALLAHDTHDPAAAAQAALLEALLQATE